MWTKPEQQTISAVARPVRVAYLVDVSDCPPQLLDSIFAESYGRWGGRRTLIVPATPQGIDPRYSEWLFYFDADVIYSFVALSDASVAELHERFAPAHLVRHQDIQRHPEAERRFDIRLPLLCLSSLSVLPAFLSRSWGLDGQPRNLKLLSKYWDRSESAFLLENFGFLSSSFSSGLIGSAHPDLYTTFTLIAEETKADPRYGKDTSATLVTSEDQVLEALGAASGPLALAQLSDFFAPFLDPGHGGHPDGTCLIVGDTPSDRLLFWNVHHCFERPFFSEITALRVPVERARDDAFLERIRKMLDRRGARSRNGQVNLVTLYSCSLDLDPLEEMAVQLRQKMRLAVRVAPPGDYAAIVPRFSDRSRIRYSLGTMMWELEARGSAEFSGSRAPVPLVRPWHMKEALPPAGFRNGNWMLDVSIDREVDHCRYSNERHVWCLPRRLRLERAFGYELEGPRSTDSDIKSIRVVRPGLLGVALNMGVTRASITTPDDLNALRLGICNEWEWTPFDHGRKDATRGRSRFADAQYSDKGRYLIGVLQLFGSVPDAFSVFMDGYWRDVLHGLGGVPTGSDTEKCEELLRVLRKRTGQRGGSLTFGGDDQLNRLAREALRAGRMIVKEPRYIRYAALKKQWEVAVETFIKAHPSRGKDDADARLRDIRYLDRSVQHLCQREVLFQGREWRCRSCYNRNWVGIGDLRGTLACSVCRRSEPAPVSGDWQFRVNPFILEAYRDHGIEAVIWALWRLSDRSRTSFYFVPSLKLWRSYPKDPGDECDAEVDAVAVVDGMVYLVEAKSSAGLDDGEIKQLLLAVERIRPDVLLIACMDAAGPTLKRAAERLREALPSEIQLEVLTFDPARLSRSPFLPG